MHPFCVPVARRALVAAAALTAAVAGCGNSRPPTMFPINLRVMNGEHPMPGARVVISNHELGATDANGRFQMQTTGSEGLRVDVTIVCPAGFVSPAQPLPVTLRSALALDRAQRNAGVETTVQCPPTQRIAAVVIRTPNRANLPIEYEGHEITRTDAQGVAHMIFRVDAAQPIALRINTTQQPQLRPASPPVTINTRDADDVYVKTVEFDEEVVRRPTVHHGPVRTGPVRIPTHRPAGGGFF